MIYFIFVFSYKSEAIKRSVNGWGLSTVVFTLRWGSKPPSSLEEASNISVWGFFLKVPFSFPDLPLGTHAVTAGCRKFHDLVVSTALGQLFSALSLPLLSPVSSVPELRASSCQHSFSWHLVCSSFCTKIVTALTSLTSKNMSKSFACFWTCLPFSLYPCELTSV